jgi:hypothetical protein
MNWEKKEIGTNTANYKISGEGIYKFPSRDVIITKADESFLVVRQVPREIFIGEKHIILTFKSGVFKNNRDREVRGEFFQWIVDNSKQIK